MSKELQAEILGRFKRFEAKWPMELQAVMGTLDRAEKVYYHSYSQLVSLNTWRTEILESIISPGSISFFLEAQNDALVSHVLARMGAWRSALKSLRSCIENVTYCLFFKDHPVELQLLGLGRYKPSFTSITEYLDKHPLVDGIEAHICGLDMLPREYATLSKAVHGSAAFQMTAETGTTCLWTDSLASLGRWRSRERTVIQSINLLLMTIFREHLQGTQRPQLRQAIGFAVSPSKYPFVKAALGINLS